MERGKRLATTVGSILAILYLLGFLAAIACLKPLEEDAVWSWRRPQVLVEAILVFFPPAWFFIESIFLYGPGHGSDADYTHAQDLASKVWVACAACAAFYWFHKLL
jgi:hypothetical protein